MSERLCLLTVHAHPDDEASKGPATVAKYHHQGVRTVLVCCTGGEEGDILNPAVDMPEVRADIAAVRRRELAAAAAVIGYDEVVHLGYRDSGMADSPANVHPECFARAPLEEAVQRLVAVLRRERPQVVVTYHENQESYPHPDHLRVHEVSVAAFEAAGDPGAFPGTGEPWQPAKLYYSGWSGARVLAMHEKFGQLGLDSPFDAAWLERAQANAATYSTVIDVAAYTDVRRLALLAHATQVDPASPFWFGLPPEVARTIHPVDEYELARSTVGALPTPDRPETDLFAGVGDLAAR
ncbi:MAG TPA: mycothiol conjugate amidase Mca [Acidimicrobiales bacterium]|nr:mycothiol conjugate amidase Mca [Acidimicrobiales bacterium]